MDNYIYKTPPSTPIKKICPIIPKKIRVYKHQVFTTIPFSDSFVSDFVNGDEDNNFLSFTKINIYKYEIRTYLSINQIQPFIETYNDNFDITISLI